MENIEREREHQSGRPAGPVVFGVCPTPVVTRIRYLTTAGSSLICLTSKAQQNTNSNSIQFYTYILEGDQIVMALDLPSRQSHCMRLLRAGSIQKQEQKPWKRMTWNNGGEPLSGPKCPCRAQQFGSIKPAAELEISKRVQKKSATSLQ